MVKEGDKVFAGQEILSMEAMKMLNSLHAERDGIVKKINVEIGANVPVDFELMEFE